MAMDDSTVPAGLADVDLLDLDRWARDGVPHEWFARLRSDAPVWRHPGGERSGAGEDAGDGFWVISRHEDVTALGRCPHVLSSDQANGGVTGLGPGDELQQLFDRVIDTAGADPPPCSATRPSTCSRSTRPSTPPTGRW